MPGKTIILPDEDEMLRRLIAVSDFSEHRDFYYPRLLKHAGQPKDANGVSRMFTDELAECSREQVFSSDAIGAVLLLEILDLIEGLIDDDEVAAEAQKYMAAELSRN